MYRAKAFNCLIQTLSFNISYLLPLLSALVRVLGIEKKGAYLINNAIHHASSTCNLKEIEKFSTISAFFIGYECDECNCWKIYRRIDK